MRMPQHCPRDLSVGCNSSWYVLPRLMEALWRCPLQHVAPKEAALLSWAPATGHDYNCIIGTRFPNQLPSKKKKKIMKALGSKNFVSAGKVVLASLWEMRMTDLYDIPGTKKDFISLSERVPETQLQHWLKRSMNAISRILWQSNLYYNGRASEKVVVFQEFKFFWLFHAAKAI